MKNSDNNKRRMYITVNQTLLDNQEDWKEQEDMVGAQKSLNSLIISIEVKSAEREKDTTPETEAKHVTRNSFETLLLKIIGGMAGYTTAKNLLTLRGQIYYTPSDVKRAKDNELCDMATIVYNAAKGCVNELPKYLIKPEDVETLDQMRVEYTKSIPGKRVAVGGSVAAGEALDKLFAETDELLKNTLDFLMLMYRDKKPEFYSKYRTSRAILDLGHGKKKQDGNVTVENKAIITGKVYDLDSKEAISGAKVLIESTNIWVLTDAQGKYMITLLPETYTIHAEKELYTSVNEMVILEMGDMLDLDLGIKKA